MASLKSTEYRDSIGRRIIKYNISTVSDKAEIVAKPWDREVFDGGYSGYTILKLQGYCAKVGKTKRDLNTLSRATIINPSGAQNLGLVSTSMTDHYTTGAGIKIVRLEGLNFNWVPTGVDIRLKGDREAVVPGTWRRINDLYMVSGGTLREPAGNIILQLSGGGKTITKITTAYGSGRLGQVTIPSGSTGYVVSWGASTVGGSSVDGAETLVSLRATCDLKGVYHKNTFVDLDQFLLKNASQEHTFIHPIKLPGRTDIKLSAQNVRSTSAARVYGHAEIYYKT